MLTYAETHYRPGGFVTGPLYRREAEVVTDVPRRVDPDNPVPVFILIKDADRFPLTLDEVIIHVTDPTGHERIARFPYRELTIADPFWWDSFNIVPEQAGEYWFDVYVQFRRGRRRRQVRIDNYGDTSHEPFRVLVADKPLPGAEGWCHGDMHCHSSFTADQIEFGAPVEVLAFAAYCMGLKWIAVTDHSYDLDDREGSYTEADPLLMKWRLLRKKAELLAESMIILPGEEVTCRTQAGRNCHLLALNSKKFIYGSGDSGEHGLNTTTERTVGEAVSSCVEWDGIAVAAHPYERVSLAERLLLNRGTWTYDDLTMPGITGIQFYNGIRDRGFTEGKAAWIRMLLEGRRVYAFGGSDAHGDMNRTRGIGIPLFSVRETTDHTFASVRTALYAPGGGHDEITAAIRDGHAVVTDGPFIDFGVYDETGKHIPGDVTSSASVSVVAACLSSQEFGTLASCRIIGGQLGGGGEQELVVTETVGSYTEELRVTADTRGFRYFRAECDTADGYLCITNPVWTGPDSR